LARELNIARNAADMGPYIYQAKPSELSPQRKKRQTKNKRTKGSQ
jgi:hypothetical protein